MSSGWWQRITYKILQSTIYVGGKLSVINTHLKTLGLHRFAFFPIGYHMLLCKHLMSWVNPKVRGCPVPFISG